MVVLKDNIVINYIIDFEVGNVYFIDFVDIKDIMDVLVFFVILNFDLEIVFVDFIVSIG